MAGGLAIGLAGAIVLLTLTRSVLFGIQPADPKVIAIATGVFVSGAMVACWLPARRAAAIDPVIALRHE
jgi:putative ABC transport system permease protein